MKMELLSIILCLIKEGNFMSNSKGGNNRDWGYASYDVDRYEDYNDSNLQYTSYEKRGSVNRYVNNGDGGHSHARWENNDDYNKGKDPDYSRNKSNSSSNPTIGEVQDNGGCYLTSACMIHMQENFDDNCEELTILRWFRNNFVSDEDIEHYYKIAPIIVEAINELEDSFSIYKYIYDNVVNPCVQAIKNEDYQFAYDRYKNSKLILEEQFTRPRLNNKLVKTLKLMKRNHLIISI